MQHWPCTALPAVTIADERFQKSNPRRYLEFYLRRFLCGFVGAEVFAHFHAEQILRR